MAVARNVMGRRRSSCLRTVLFLFLVTFVWLQLHILSLGNGSSDTTLEVNDSAAAIFSMVPPVLHKFLTSRARNGTAGIDILRLINSLLAICHGTCSTSTVNFYVYICIVQFNLHENVACVVYNLSI